ncbi:MAG: hypothetical protein PWQ15_870 [Methanobacterium sp.]|jgi:hypothetical protein|uniref:hypothetical protein n=1 Tax=Methanobacterium sp. TaxID=2164 RepID=UPI0003C96E58|nr:hypothetical protein [Methanobacterium sp.]MDI3549768.1 hypothetical protein [Methanobacterium sp.]CDG65839.1 hypothetical protein MBMB1_1753 [Methanobacterium sp. MB1]
MAKKKKRSKKKSSRKKKALKAVSQNTSQAKASTSKIEYKGPSTFDKYMFMGVFIFGIVFLLLYLGGFVYHLLA